jgi:histidinol-phosphate phosphatase family protein
VKVEAVFLDRDGTIGGDDTVHYPGKFELFPYSRELIEKLKGSGIKVFSFTNQPGIARGEAAVQEFIAELQGFGFDDIFICPHGHKAGCGCRKPAAGMLLSASEKHHVNLENCVVIGDRWSDMVAASKTDSMKILVRTGAGNSSLNEHLDKIKDITIDYIAEDLQDAVDWLYNQRKVAISR